MNELKCIRAFVKVVEVGSFAEAARQTDTAKTVIATRINQLEEHLELQLLQRSTRRLNVTDAGTEFYERCVHLLAEFEQAKAAVHSTEWALSGTFRVSCNSSLIAAFLAQDLCEFRSQHPQLQIELRQHDRFCDPVQEGYDVSLQPTENKFTGSATLQWQSSDDAMLYAAFSQGHKTGGFSDRIDNPMADYEYDQENVNSIEFGAKTTRLNGALAFNIAVFRMDIEGLQLATQLPGTVPAFSVSNAADSTSEGVELDLTWAVNEVWTLGANAAFIDASYDSFPGAECHAGTPVTPDPVTGTCDLAGLPLIFAPDLKGTVFADFLVEDAFGGWDFGGRFDYTHSDEHYTDISYQNNVLTDAYSISNAGLRLISPNERVTVSLIGRNLSDEAFCAWCIPSGPNVLAAMNPTREIGLRISADFD